MFILIPGYCWDYCSFILAKAWLFTYLLIKSSWFEVETTCICFMYGVNDVVVGGLEYTMFMSPNSFLHLRFCDVHNIEVCSISGCCN